MLIKKLFVVFTFVVQWGIEARENQVKAKVQDDAVIVFGAKSKKGEKSSSTALSEDEVNSFKLKTIEDLIMHLGSVQIKESHGDGGSELQIRNLGGKYSAVKVDGILLPKDENGVTDLSSLNPLNIKSIVLKKGIQGSEETNSAFGGVLEIETKEPQSSFVEVLTSHEVILKDQERGQETRPQKLGVQLSLKGKKNHHNLSYQNDLVLPVDYNDSQGSLFTKDSLKKESEKFHYRGSLKKKKNKFQWGGYLTKEEGTSFYAGLSPTQGFYQLQDKNQRENQTFFGHWQSDRGTSKLKLSLSRSHLKEKHKLQFRPGTRESGSDHQLDSESWGGTIALRDMVWGRHTFSTGAELLLTKLSVEIEEDETANNLFSAPIDAKTESITHLFLRDDIAVNSWDFSIGSRYSRDRKGFSRFNQFLGASYFFSNFDAKSELTLAQGTRFPSMAERYYLLDHRNIANYIVLGNENLAPEQALSIQKKFSLKRRNYELETSLFYTQFDNYIGYKEQIEDLSNVKLFRTVNKERVYTGGAEIEVKYAPIERKYNFLLSYGYYQSFDESTGRELLFFSNHKLNLRTSYLWSEKLNFSLSSYWVGESQVDEEKNIPSPGYIKVDLASEYKYSKNIFLFSNINNILNNKRETLTDVSVSRIDLRPQKGLSVFFGFKLKGEFL